MNFSPTFLKVFQLTESVVTTPGHPQSRSPPSKALCGAHSKSGKSSLLFRSLPNLNFNLYCRSLFYFLPPFGKLQLHHQNFNFILCSPEKFDVKIICNQRMLIFTQIPAIILPHTPSYDSPPPGALRCFSQPLSFFLFRPRLVQFAGFERVVGGKIARGLLIFGTVYEGISALGYISWGLV